MITRSALGKRIEKRIGIAYPNGAENIDTAPQERVGEETDRRTDHRHPSRAFRQGEELLQRVVDQGRAGDQQDVGLGNDAGRLLRRPEERQLLSLQRRGILLEHQKWLVAAFELPQERHESTDHDDLVTRADLRRVKGINANAELCLSMQ